MIKKVFLFVFIASLFYLFACHYNKAVKSKLNLIVFEIDNGWGYKINLDNKTIIYQLFIPVVEGNKAFHTKIEALKAGEIVLQKIKTHQAPIITKEELIKAGISI